MFPPMSPRSLPRSAWHAPATLVWLLLVTCGAAGPPPRSFEIGASAWRVIERESGPDNYYRVVSEPGATFVRASYRPRMKTTVLGWQTPDADRGRVRKLRWTWRARTLPRGADECVKGKGDSAAVVYLTWKRGLRYYTLKYVWSTSGVKGRICSRKRNLFVAQDTIIAESGPPIGAWRSMEIDLPAAFRRHFEGGDPTAKVPDFVGIGIMTDGDQTQSQSSADYGTFTLWH